MDSRSHDDFFPPERSVPDDVFPATETASTAGQPAHDDASGRGDLDDAIDDLELELASLLTPDLEAIEIEAVEADASDLDGLDFAAELGAVDLVASERRAPGAEAPERSAREVDADGRTDAAADARGAEIAELHAAEPTLALPPETAEARTDATPEPVQARAFGTDGPVEAVGPDLSLDEPEGTIAAQAAAPEVPEVPAIAAETWTVVAESWSGDAHGAGETDAVAETSSDDAGTDAVATMTSAVAQAEILPSGDETTAGVATAGADAGDPVAAAAPAGEPLDEPLDEPLAPMPVAEAAAPADAEAEMPPVEAVAAAAPQAEAAPTQDVEPALSAIAEAPDTADAPAAEAEAEAPGDESCASAVLADAVAEVDAAVDGGSGIVLRDAIMVAPQPEGAAATDASFEEALGAQDIPAAGFEAAVRKAAAQAAGRFLFQMPVHTVHDCQRVAAVNLAGDETPTTMLVLLAADGRSFRMEDARASDNPFAGMAVSYGGLLAHLKSLPTRAAA